MAIEKFNMVRLKSGGPQMVVIGFVGEEGENKVATFAYQAAGHKIGDAICQWFDDKQTPQSKVFPLGALKEVEGSKE